MLVRQLFAQGSIFVLDVNARSKVALFNSFTTDKSASLRISIYTLSD